MKESMSLFDHFMPHGMCYQWRPDILWLNVVSDSIIALAYILIPAALLYFMHKRKRSDVAYPSMVYMFCVFITACGVTHVFAIWTVWSGQYGIQGLIKSFTAAASLATAVMLYPLIPKLLALRTSRELEETNDQLKNEIEQRQESEQHSMQLQSELARVGRITTVGRMATGLAHELNQPLLSISASTDTAILAAKSNPQKSALLFECLDDVQRDTQRAGEIIRTLREFLSEKAPTKSTVNVNKLISDTVRLVMPDARNASVEIVGKPGAIPFINANSVQIAQVLVNLLRNSVEAIASSNKPATGNQIVITSAYEKDNVVISIEDTGPGVSDDRDLFAPFESIKTSGMGVGLSICREIVEAHGGVLGYTSDGMSGTIFKFSLPAD